MYPAYRKLKTPIRSFELGTKFDCLRQKYEKIFKKTNAAAKPRNRHVPFPVLTSTWLARGTSRDHNGTFLFRLLSTRG